MLKCEKCGIEYPSEIDFHQGGAGGQLICISCHQSSVGSPEDERVASDAPTGAEPEPSVIPVGESIGEGEKTGSRLSKGGLIAAALFVVFGVLSGRETGFESLMALAFWGVALALGIRSFTGGMTWGRGILTALGGYWVGMLVVMLALADSDDLATLIGPAVIAFACLWFGFKRGKVKWGKKRR